MKLLYLATLLLVAVGCTADDPQPPADLGPDAGTGDTAAEMQAPDAAAPDHMQIQDQALDTAGDLTRDTTHDAAADAAHDANYDADMAIADMHDTGADLLLDANHEAVTCGPEPHWKVQLGSCQPSCGRAMGDAALAKEGTEANYQNFGECLMAHPSAPCDPTLGHYLTQTWDCGTLCCIYPDGDQGTP